ncbi:hypothetical protein STEG23_011026 [Scotinomys teguina]
MGNNWRGWETSRNIEGPGEEGVDGEENSKLYKRLLPKSAAREQSVLTVEKSDEYYLVKYGDALKPRYELMKSHINTRSMGPMVVGAVWKKSNTGETFEYYVQSLVPHLLLVL